MQSPERRLFEIASTQQGYFTAQQAVSAGYSVTNHSYHTKRGNWIREWRGIYRLHSFPHNPDAQYALWSLWSANKKQEVQGTYSFDTALCIYDVCDIMPEKLHMTVPSRFRCQGKLPDILVLHRENLDEEDYQWMEGYRVTTPAKTLENVVAQDQIQEHLVEQAARELVRRGLITRQEVLSLIKAIPRSAKYFVEKTQRRYS